MSSPQHATAFKAVDSDANPPQNESEKKAQQAVFSAAAEKEDGRRPLDSSSSSPPSSSNSRETEERDASPGKTPTDDDDDDRGHDADRDPPRKRRKSNAVAVAAAAAAAAAMPTTTTRAMPNIPLRKLIPPKDRSRTKEGRPSGEDHDGGGGGPSSYTRENGSALRFNWSTVVSRARSHPHEAAAPYFAPPHYGREDDEEGCCDSSSSYASTPSSSTSKSTSKRHGCDVYAYKPLHAMLRHDPPFEAVEAVLLANPAAASEVTFEGSALRIAAECGIGSMPALRLLLVAEMAMMRKRCSLLPPSLPPRLGEDDEDDDRDDVASPGHNPIGWIAERRVPPRTAAMLLRWYPAGAVRPSLWAADDGFVPRDSPLIEIVDDFARDHYDDSDDDDEERKEEEGANERHGRESPRRERRWEKLLHVLHAADPARRRPGITTTRHAPFRPVHAWVRCIACPLLGLERCRPYAAWSVLRAMRRRVPDEFAKRDASDGDRAAFQILAESDARDCRLRCREEVGDVVECLVDADCRSAFS